MSHGGIIVEALVDTNRVIVEVGTQNIVAGASDLTTVEIFHGPPGPTGADATTTSKGIIQLTGDLAGTAGAPTVPALVNKINTSEKGSPSGVASLGSDGLLTSAQRPPVPDATSGTTGGIRLAGQLGGSATSPTVPGLAAKLDLSQKGAASGVAALGADGILASSHRPPADIEQVQDIVAGLLTQGPNITLSYNDSLGTLTISASASNIPDATTTTKGAVQLAGQLGGTASSPTVPGLASKVDNSEKGAPNGVASLGADGLLSSTQLPAIDLELVRDTIASFIVGGTNMTVVHNDAANTLTLSSSGGGGTGTVSDATTTAKGVVQLAGDLSGTAASPTVPNKISNSEKGAPNGVATLGADGLLSSAQRAGAQDASTGTKGIVRLANHLGGTADNPTVPGLAGKINTTEKGAANGLATLGADGLLTSSQRTGAPDATATTKGSIQLAGDLGGTAAGPTVPKLFGLSYRYMWEGALGWINGFTQSLPASRVTGVTYEFVGPAANNPNSAGLMTNGDSWFDTTNGVQRFRYASGLVPPIGSEPPPDPEEPPPPPPPDPTFTANKWASPSGSDNNPGTEASPYRTLQKLADNTLAGQVGALKAGSYSANSSGGYVLDTGATDGTSTNPRRIVADPRGARPLITGNIFMEARYFFLEGCDLDMYSLRGSNYIPLQVAGDAHGVRIKNCFIDWGHSEGQGILIGEGSSGVATNNVEILGNILTRVKAGNSTTAAGHGVYHQRGSGLVVSGNVFYEIGTQTPITGSRAVQVYPNGTSSYVGYNTIDTCGGGIVYGDEGGGGSNNHVFENNIFSNLINSSAGGGGRGAITSVGSSSGNVARNNHTHNCTNGGISGTGLTQTGTTTGDPNYVNRTARNYKLNSGSPAAGKGAWASSTPPPY